MSRFYSFGATVKNLGFVDIDNKSACVFNVGCICSLLMRCYVNSIYVVLVYLHFDGMWIPVRVSGIYIYYYGPYVAFVVDRKRTVQGWSIMFERSEIISYNGLN